MKNTDRGKGGGGYLGTKRDVTEDGGDFIIRRFIICNPSQILSE
jgi:hypothetical protein